MTITFFNQKGGVGKTTSSVLLIDYLQKQGQRVLAIDLDPQGSLSEVYSNDYSTSLLEYFTRSRTLEDCVTKINPNLDLLASNVRLMDLPQIDSAYLDDEKINFSALFSSYDYVVVDCQPSFSWFSRLAIKLATFVLMPIQPSRFCFEALDGALREVSRMKSFDFKAFYVFENKYRKQRVVLKDNFRELFSQRLGDRFLPFALTEAISIDERTAQDINYFQTEKPKPNPQVVKFFDSLMEVLCG